MCPTVDAADDHRQAFSKAHLAWVSGFSSLRVSGIGLAFRRSHSHTAGKAPHSGLAFRVQNFGYRFQIPVSYEHAKSLLCSPNSTRNEDTPISRF